MSSLRRVERRLASESSSKGTPTKRKFHCERPDNEVLGKIPNSEEGFANSKEKFIPNTLNIESNSKEIQSGMLSQYTEFSFSPPIIACRAEPYMTETPASTNSDTAAEFFSYDDLWMNSSGEAQLESSEEFPNDGDNNIEEKEFGGFDDIVDLCAVLRLDGNYLLSPRESHQCDERHPNRTRVEDHDPTFYSKVAQVKGPKSESEVEALDAWIQHFADRKKEPSRLVHLLLAMAAVQSNSGKIEFPETAQEFLLSWPPSRGCLHPILLDKLYSGCIGDSAYTYMRQGK